ncbi:hypothetical protein GCM10011512_16560 [Tersicoccus solisilvae]|uniref:Uncharacterized protein n=1 Tax=Tersicoccus solisilvae TaxID=1882339 RepID=A0ABQ1P4U5_9MICC|nr:hypothetical protein GCM10011512_16560 [Tersicoccus solisilvae]
MPARPAAGDDVVSFRRAVTRKEKSLGGTGPFCQRREAADSGFRGDARRKPLIIAVVLCGGVAGSNAAMFDRGSPARCPQVWRDGCGKGGAGGTITGWEE